MTTSDYDRDRIKNAPDQVKKDLNADPITGEPGSHPVGTGLGAAGGAALGNKISKDKQYDSYHGKKWKKKHKHH